MNLKSFSNLGDWWLPEKPERKFSGRLEFESQEGIGLKLSFDREDSNHPFEESDVLQPEIITGETSKGEKITLVNCYEDSRTHYRTQNSKKLVLWFKATYLIKGEHFKEKSEIKFSSIKYTFPYVEKYLNLRSVFERIQPEESEFDVKTKFKIPENFEADLGDYKLNIFFRDRAKTGDRQNVSYEQEAVISFEPNEDDLSHYDDLVTLRSYFADFISLMTRISVDPASIEAYTDSKLEFIGEMGENKKPDIPNSVEIYRKIKHNSEENERYHPQTDSLIQFHKLELPFEELMQKWYKNRREHETFYDLYFATKYNPSMQANNQFLNLMQGLESYHRGKFEGEYKGEIVSELKNEMEKIKPEKKEHKKLYDKINGYKSRLTEYSIRDKIEEVKTEIDQVLPQKVSEDSDFVSRVVQYRHNLTHPSSNIHNELDYNQLVWDITRLKMISEACILQDLSIDQELIRNSFRRQTEYQKIVEGIK